MDTVAGRADRRSRVGGSADRQKRQQHIVETCLVAAERGKERLPEIRHVPDCGLDMRIEQDRLGGKSERRRQAGAAEQQHRLAAKATAERADAVWIDARRPLRSRQKRIERCFQLERTQCLHRDKVLVMQQRIAEIGQVFDRYVGDTAIAVKRRDDDITPAREHFDRVEVIAGNRTARETVRKQ